jgi:DNA topoisomerase-1
MLNSAHNVENPTFQKNFFSDFKEMLDKTGHGKDKDGNKVKILKFEKCELRNVGIKYFSRNCDGRAVKL